jgi:hypothetical protein
MYPFAKVCEGYRVSKEMKKYIYLIVRDQN